MGCPAQIRGECVVTIEIRAAIFMPEEELSNAALISPCFGTIAKRGYAFDSIVSDWEQLMTMLREQLIQVVVYARPEHIDPSWLPRFELAEHGPNAAADPEPPVSRSASRRLQRPK